jgi:hypothetical protein
LVHCAIRAHALCIVAENLLALVVAERRWRRRGGIDGQPWEVSGRAIAFGTKARTRHGRSRPSKRD